MMMFILHDLVTHNHRHYGTLVYLGSRRINIINHTACPAVLDAPRGGRATVNVSVKPKGDTES